MQAMLALAMGTALLGIDVGWQPIEEGGLEYIVQIEPETLARMKPGDELATGIRPALRDVRRYRIVIGKGPLPRIALPEKPVGSPGGTTVPRMVPQPLAADDQRSILVPSERAPESRPAPIISLPPPPSVASSAPARSVTEPRLAAVPRSTAGPIGGAPASRTMPALDALPEAAPRSAAVLTLPPPPTVAPPRNTWQAPAAEAPPAAKAPPLISVPAKTVEAPQSDAAKALPAPAGAADRYRDEDRYRDDDRYRDFAPPAAGQPKSAPPLLPIDKNDDRAANKSTSASPRSAEKVPAELVGPLLPVDTSDRQLAQSKPSVKAPSFDLGSASDRPMAKSVAPKPLPTAGNEPSAPASSSLLADTFGSKPARLLSDPSVRPASVEPPSAMESAKPAAATASPTAPSPTTAPGSTAEPPARPWLALTLTLFALFASLGGNVFLGWVAHDARSRYGLLLRDSHAT